MLSLIIYCNIHCEDVMFDQLSYLFLPATLDPILAADPGQMIGRAQRPQDSEACDLLRAKMTFNSVSQMPSPGLNTEGVRLNC